MEAKLVKLRLALRDAFRIAHGSYSWRESLVLSLENGGVAGLGEAPVVPYYGVPAEEIEADLLSGVSAALVEEALGLPELPASLGASAFRHAASAAAFQAAVTALRSKRDGLGPAAALGIVAAEMLPAGDRSGGASSYTVAFDDDPEAMASRAAACGFRRLKVKAGIPGDLERLRRIRERLPEAIIRVDANQGWSAKEAPAKMAELERLGVELVEEPMAGSPAELERLARSTRLPILLDESARDAEAVRRYAEEAPSVAGIVIKQAKNGGPAASLALARLARSLGMDAMLSSMVETSLGVGAALALAPLCRWCDLDAPLLLAEDPFTGLSYPGEVPTLADEGISPDPALAARLAGTRPFMEA
jgi:L-alanine-DL-glutamate epimerase-like enolase superfamily enzyme